MAARTAPLKRSRAALVSSAHCESSRQSGGAAHSAPPRWPLATGCGESQQNSSEKSDEYRVDVVTPRSPASSTSRGRRSSRSRSATPASETVPSPAISIRSFTYRSSFPELADPLRPVWVVEKGPGPGATKPPVSTQEVSQPGGGQTAYVSTWTLGPLKSGAQQTFTWEVVPSSPASGLWPTKSPADSAATRKAVSASGGPSSASSRSTSPTNRRSRTSTREPAASKKARLPPTR